MLFIDDGSSIGDLTGTLIDLAGDVIDEIIAADSYVLAIGDSYMSENEARSGVATTPDSLSAYTV